MSSSAKTSAGIVGVPLVVADEPAAWEVVGGELMYDMLETAKGKPDSPLRTLYVGTIWPTRGGWWPELVKRGFSPLHVRPGHSPGMISGGNQWPEIKRCNPLVSQVRG